MIIGPYFLLFFLLEFFLSLPLSQSPLLLTRPLPFLLTFVIIIMLRLALAKHSVQAGSREVNHLFFLGYLVSSSSFFRVVFRFLNRGLRLSWPRPGPARRAANRNDWPLVFYVSVSFEGLVRPQKSSLGSRGPNILNSPYGVLNGLKKA